MRAAVNASGYNCFANPVRADVMMDGRKIAGAAQRRTRRGLLQQGSIQNFAMKTDLAQKFAQALSANCSEFEANEEFFSAHENSHGKNTELNPGAQALKRRASVSEPQAGFANCRITNCAEIEA